MKSINTIILSVLIFSSLSAFAAEKKPEVLDFEADVIEGQKKTLDLFLQLDVEKADLSSVLYDRGNFNDFHAVDSKRRPKFSNPKRGVK